MSDYLRGTLRVETNPWLSMSMCKFLLHLPPSCAALTEPSSPSLMRAGDLHQVFSILPWFFQLFLKCVCAVITMIKSVFNYVPHFWPASKLRIFYQPFWKPDLENRATAAPVSFPLTIRVITWCNFGYDGIAWYLRKFQYVPVCIFQGLTPPHCSLGVTKSLLNWNLYSCIN